MGPAPDIAYRIDLAICVSEDTAEWTSRVDETSLTSLTNEKCHRYVVHTSRLGYAMHREVVPSQGCCE